MKKASTTAKGKEPKIFADIRKVCSQRLLFNNRTELTHCQNRKQIEVAGRKANHYCTEEILAAAEEYFIVKSKDTFGKYPLWVLEAR